MSDNNGNLKRISGVFWNESQRTGKKYFAFRLTAEAIEAFETDCKLFIFRNEKKRNDSSPDYVLYCEEARQELEPEPQQVNTDESMPF